MEMSMNLSEKDKNTLIIVVVALLIFGIAFLGIKPAFTNSKETKETNASLQEQKETMKTEIESLPTYKTNLETAKAEYKTTADRVFGDLDNDYIHDAVVALVRADNLQISSLTIEGTSQQGMNTYTVTEDGATGGTSDGAVNMVGITTTVSGTVAQLINFIDTLNTTEGTFLKSVSFSNGTEAISVSVTFVMVLSETFA